MSHWASPAPLNDVETWCDDLLAALIPLRQEDNRMKHQSGHFSNLFVDVSLQLSQFISLQPHVVLTPVRYFLHHTEMLMGRWDTLYRSS
jgi:hypothetical protein